MVYSTFVDAIITRLNNGGYQPLINALTDIFSSTFVDIETRVSTGKLEDRRDYQIWIYLHDKILPRIIMLRDEPLDAATKQTVITQCLDVLNYIKVINDAW